MTLSEPLVPLRFCLLAGKPSHDRLTQLLRYNTDRRVLLAALPVVSSWCPGVWQVPLLKKKSQETSYSIVGA